MLDFPHVNVYTLYPRRQKYVQKIYIMILAGLLLTGCTSNVKKSPPATTKTATKAPTETPALPVVKIAEKETFRYLSKDYFYTDFEGESVVQTDVEDAYTICQRNLYGELTDSYYMGENFIGIFYVDENWLYYSEKDNDNIKPDKGYIDDDDINCPESVYRIPLSHKDGKEIPVFSKKEFLFTAPKGLSNSDFTANSFLQIVDNTIYYFARKGLGTYNLETKENKYYPVPNIKKNFMLAAGTQYMIAEGEKQCTILINLETGKSKVMKTDRHPWIRLGKELYLGFPYSTSGEGDILLDLNSGKTIEVLLQKEGKRVAKEVGVPLDKNWSSSDDMSIKYIGYYNHRVYAETKYTVTLMDKKGREVIIEDAVCVSRNMDEEKNWTIEKEITAHSRKKILEIYKKVKSGNYKIKKDSAYYNEELRIGEGITNGIFYFDGYYKKDGKMAIDIYDLDKKEFRTIYRNSPETFYPFYNNSHEMMYFMHDWQNIRCLAPIMSQTETIWDQNQKRKQ